MTPLGIAWLFPFVLPALVLLAALNAASTLCRMPCRGPRWLVVLGAISASAVALPVGGLPIARWLAGVSTNVSIPLLGLLADHITRAFLGRGLLCREGRVATWWFGAVAGVALYPAALGWGSFDTYALGWSSSPLFMATGVVTVWCVWKRTGLSVLLLLAILAWQLNVQESSNYWDYLVDPLYVFWSLAGLVTIVKSPTGRSQQRG